MTDEKKTRLRSFISMQAHQNLKVREGEFNVNLAAQACYEDERLKPRDLNIALLIRNQDIPYLVD
jgi:hypothetical protein